MKIKKTSQNNFIFGSFRDPNGTVFQKNNSFYRRINLIYKENYNLLLNSGLYKSLAEDGLLIPHQEIRSKKKNNYGVFKIIKHEKIPFISYPYEWSFSQLKHAALTTLQIQKKALEFGMSLKDSSAYNIQFRKGKPVLIDTLSFEKYQENLPWVGYKQFCQHFLAPLALMYYKDLRMSGLSSIHIDGIPLDLTSKLLPLITYFNFPLLTHIHLHAKSQKYLVVNKKEITKLGNSKVSKLSLFGLIDSLESAIRSLNYRFQGTQWANYYSDTNYSKAGFEQKKQIIRRFLKSINPKIVWDLGANTGVFSQIANELDILTISLDSDPEAVEKNYLRSVEKEEKNILPILIDLTNPSPGIGWSNKERMSLEARGPADMVFALALIHHLAISNNLPLVEIASFLKNICLSLIVEFIPKSDSNVQKLLLLRKDIFPNYTLGDFTREFSKHFTIKSSVKIRNSQRVLFLMVRK